MGSSSWFLPMCWSSSEDACLLLDTVMSATCLPVGTHNSPSPFGRPGETGKLSPVLRGTPSHPSRSDKKLGSHRQQRATAGVQVQRRPRGKCEDHVCCQYSITLLMNSATMEKRVPVQDAGTDAVIITQPG